MIAEIRSSRKLQLVLACIIFSLFLHVVMVYFNIVFNKVQDYPAPELKKIPPRIQTKQKPMTMMKQPPQPTRRIHRAGTSKQAPKTEKALAPQKPKQALPLPSAAQPTPQPPQQKPPEPKQEPKQAPPKQVSPEQVSPKQVSPERIKPKQTQQAHPKQRIKKTTQKKEPKPPRQKPVSGRPAMKKFFEDSLKEEQTSSERATQTDDERKTLSFLSPNNLYHSMRERALTQPQPGIAEQYGDMKYLHYNQKIYQALQQAMNIVVRNLPRAQYQSALESIQHPARIRFAVDKNGKLKGLSLVTSSGNPYYDMIAQQVIREASYPPIPKSFNMNTTYHTYGIILYNDGSPQNNLGVSPYLEGE